MKIRSAYDCDVEPVVRDWGKSMTQQHSAQECDVNFILRKYEKTGMLPIVSDEGQYGDFSSVPSFQEAHAIIARAESQFAGLDVALRRRFGNDPGAFLEFCSDEKNRDEMVKLGLIAPVEAPVVAPAVTPVVAQSASTVKEEAKPEVK